MGWGVDGVRMTMLLRSREFGRMLVAAVTSLSLPRHGNQTLEVLFTAWRLP